LGGSLKPEGLGDGPKLDSRLQLAQLILMNRIISLSINLLRESCHNLKNIKDQE
jgi:hypothetical protein